MIDIIKQEIEANGDKSKIISINILDQIIEDVENIKNTGWLNDFQKHIVNDMYDFHLPEADYKINSIIIIATPSRLVTLVFNKNGKKISTMLPPTFADYTSTPKRVREYLDKLMNTHGYHISNAPDLPYKLIAVRSGLSKYGRNNISYIDGIGSFYSMNFFYSDLPCENRDLYEIRRMDTCRKCTLCMQNCPTNAILENRFLINNKRCLTYFNESGGWDFPDWIDESAHNSIYGCVKCQIVCPHNREQLKHTIETVEFSEDETDMLLKDNNYEGYSYELKEKVKNLCMEEFLSAVPRNLKVLIDRE